MNERANTKVEGLEKEVDEAIQRAVEGASTGIEEQAERTSAELREHMAAVAGAMAKRAVRGAALPLMLLLLLAGARGVGVGVGRNTAVLTTRVWRG
jgi:hypothetical protein